MVIPLILLSPPVREIRSQDVTSIRAYLPFVAETAGAMRPEAFSSPMPNLKANLPQKELKEFLRLIVIGGPGPKYQPLRTRLRIVFKGGELLMDADGIARLNKGKAVYEYALPAYAYNRAGTLLRVASL